MRLGAEVETLLKRQLLAPVGEFLSRPSKRIRAQVVELGFQLGGGVGEASTALCSELGEMIEVLHAGSLIVDDIEDGSLERRGAPTLHRKHGVPVALNAGNWMYFWPLQRIRELGLDSATELKLYQAYHSTLLRAHYGQALDLGVPADSLPQSQVAEICLASLEMKSGALMALAAEMGALAAGGTADREAIRRFGLKFGVALQMFDDLGNIQSRLLLGPGGKRFEDLYHKRLSWLWAAVARICDARAYADFVSAVDRLPNESFLLPWFEIHQVIPRAYEDTREYLGEAIQELEASISVDAKAKKIIQSIWEQLEKAYV
jgi:geranylgeranyl pyrophosphate synthase